MTWCRSLSMKRDTIMFPLRIILVHFALTIKCLPFFPLQATLKPFAMTTRPVSAASCRCASTTTSRSAAASFRTTYWNSPESPLRLQTRGTTTSFTNSQRPPRLALIFTLKQNASFFNNVCVVARRKELSLPCGSLESIT